MKFSERLIGDRTHCTKVNAAALLLVWLLAGCLPIILAGSTPAMAKSLAAFTAGNRDDEIVYLDNTGTIRVLDPQPVPGHPEVKWSSPTSGWTDFALGDVNADGDQEIVAIGADGATGKLAVYDPVVADGSQTVSGKINGIPWATLYETKLTGIPHLVATGDFDQSTPGDEIIFDYELQPQDRIHADDFLRFAILKAEKSPPDGTAWATLATMDTGNDWTDIATGDIYQYGTDEVALMDSKRGNLSVYTLRKGELRRITRNSNQNRAWRSIMFSQFVGTGSEELLAVREASYPFESAYVFRYKNRAMFDLYKWIFIPNPTFVFKADIMGNGDDEMVMLRSVPPELTDRPRLFVRDNANDKITMRETALDPDNGYKSGVGADVNGDGRDAIVIMRNNRIRIYTDPENSEAFQDYDVQTNSRTIKAGNLDANFAGSASSAGVAPGGVRAAAVAGANPGKIVVPSSVALVPDQLTVSLKPGEHSDPYTVAVTNINSDKPIPFSARVANQSPWVSIKASSDHTPANINILFDAQGLQQGEYSDQIIVDFDDPQLGKQSSTVDLHLRIAPDVIVSPQSISLLYTQCDKPLSPQTRTVSIDGAPGVAFSAELLDAVPWVRLKTSSGTVPGKVTFVVDPGAWGRNSGEAELDISTKIDGDPVDVGEVSIKVVCGGNQIFVPSIANQPAPTTSAASTGGSNQIFIPIIGNQTGR